MSAQTIERHGERARLASWRGNDLVAHLAPVATNPLSAQFVSGCLDWLQRRGYSSVITCALSPRECEGFLEAGFEVHEELDLLSHDLTGLPPVPRGLRRAQRWDRRAVIDLDRAAFPSFWRLHDGGLEDALSATPHVRFRVAAGGWLERSGGLVGAPAAGVYGYAITGRGARTGYLQRLAVHPGVQGRGLGRALVTDALAWMRRRGTARALVNTQRTNQAALALYRACGFRLLPDGLSVLSRTL